jgi:hypothetical protein
MADATPTPALAQPPKKRGCATCAIIALIVLVILMFLGCCCSFTVMSLIGAKGQPGTIIKPSEASGDKPAGSSVAIPTGLNAAAKESTIDLNWNSLTGGSVEQVRIYRSEKPGKAFAQIAEVESGDTTFVDKEAFKGVTYYYVVTAITAAGAESGNSNQVAAAIDTPPLVPKGVYSWKDVQTKAKADAEYLKVLTKVTGLTVTDVDGLVKKEDQGITLKKTLLIGTIITNTMEDYRIVPNFTLTYDRDALTDENGVPHVLVKCGNPMKLQQEVTQTAVLIQQVQVFVTTVINVLPPQITTVIINASQVANVIAIAVLPEGILVDFGPGFRPPPPGAFVDPTDFGEDVYTPGEETELEEGEQWIKEGKLKIAAVPPDPGPGELVTMIIDVLPAKAGVTIEYNVQGSDGYTASGSLVTDANGEVQFTIPGGAEGVADTITVNAPSLNASGTVQYTF